MSQEFKNKTIEEAANLLYAQVYALTGYQDQVAEEGDVKLAECLGFAIGLARDAVGKLNDLDGELTERALTTFGDDTPSTPLTALLEIPGEQ